MKISSRFLLFALIVLMHSCVNTRPIQYVQGQFDTAQLSKYVTKEPIIQKADLINIIVYSDNPTATAIFNIPNASGNSSGYLVDEQGNIQFQGIGSIHVEGLTKLQLTELLNSKLNVFLQNPYYNIRLSNFKITMLGELSREGQIIIPSERVNLLEAIGLAGGLTVYSRRDNILIIREVNGKREFGRVDITDPKIFNSPFYYLQQNDMVLVEQTRNKVQNTDQSTARNISLASTVISTLLVIYTVFNR